MKMKRMNKDKKHSCQVTMNCQELGRKLGRKNTDSVTERTVNEVRRIRDASCKPKHNCRWY